MIAVLGIVAFLTALIILLIIGRVATLALMMTGLSKDIARFQSRSALTGAGFTTRESERVLEHPARRRVIELLMVAQSAGLATIIVSLVLSFSASHDSFSIASRLGWLAGGLVAFALIARSRWLEQLLDRVLAHALHRWSRMQLLDYARLLRLQEGYRVTQLRLEKDSWLENRRVGDVRLRDEGILLLAVQRNDGSYVAVPTEETKLYSGDTLVLYGHESALRQLRSRREGPSGDREHDRAACHEAERRQRQQRRDEEHERRRRPETGSTRRKEAES